MKKILLVDNSNFIINVLKDILSTNFRLELYTARTYKEAKNLIENNHFFIVVSNTVLPDALNAEILPLLKQNNLPTILLSTKIDKMILSQLDHEHIIDYVVKDSYYGLNYVGKLIEIILYCENKEVLVVEDSRSMALLMQIILEKLLLKVHVCKNGEEAIQFLKKNKKIELLISDYNMPTMNGLELIKQIKSNSEYGGLEIIVTTIENDKNLKINLYKHGANDLILKPIIEEELISKLITIFSNKKHIEEISTYSKIFDENIIASTTNKDGNILSTTQAFCNISGYNKEELLGKNHSIVRHPNMNNTVYEDLWSTIKAGEVWKGEMQNIRKDGTYYWVSAIIEPYTDSKGKVIGYNAVRHDITDKKRIYELSITDGLTNLYNRRYFNEMAYSFLEKGIKERKDCAFLLLDIDNFKKYNDTYGHQEGDNVLIKVSKALKERFNTEEAMVFRLGGEEFGILLKAKDRQQIEILAQEARLSIADLNIEHKLNLPSLCVTASFGAAIITKEDTLNIDTIYKKTDELLYEAKENGRNQVKFSTKIN